MLLDWLRPFCLTFPGATENIQWGNDLVFKVGGKMFAVAGLEPGPHVLSFKCSPEDFAELNERPGIHPAPYLARAHWVAIERESTMARRELEGMLRKAYDLIAAKLTKAEQAKLTAMPSTTAKRSTAARSRSSAKKR